MLNRDDMLAEIYAEIDYFSNYKFALYSYIMHNYYSASDKIHPTKITMIFKEITLIDNHIQDLYRIAGNHNS